MKRAISLVLALALSTGLLAQESAPAKKSSAKKRASSSSSVAAELQQLKNAIAAQQQQIQQLQQQVQQRDQQVQQAQQAANDAASRAADASAKASDAANTQADIKTTVSRLDSTVSDLRANNVGIAESLQTEQKRVGGLESPASINYKGITITPGGFIEAAGIYRTHNENSSVSSATAVANTPLAGQANTHLSEFRGDARQSRITLLGEGKVNDMKFSGYYEVDFLGAAPTANQVESNSFNLRQRQLWGQVEFDNGLTVSTGQAFSLITTTRKGQALRSEFLPQTIDAQYNVGYNWARQYMARVCKNINNKIWLAFSVENPETNLAPGAPIAPGATALNPGITVLGLNNSPNATSPSGLLVLNNTPGANGVSTNLAPDLIAKAVFEPGWGHYELKFLGRAFRDRVSASASAPGTNQVTYGGGLGAGVILPLIAKKLDFVGQGLVGSGIGRYGSGVGPDVTVRPDGKLATVHAYQALVGLEGHPNPKWDTYVYFGEEYYAHSYAANSTGALVGYGAPTLNVSNCTGAPGAPGDSTACAAQTRYVWQAQPGFYYRFYKGPKGTVQWGASYSYVYRKTYPGLNGAPLTSPTLAPKGIENIVMTAFRYILP